MVSSEVKSSLLHDSGIRDCYKVYGVSPQPTIEIILPEEEKIKILPQQKYYERLEIDEMYSFVSKKSVDFLCLCS